MPHACLRTIRDEHASLTAMLTSAQLMVDRGPGARPEVFFSVLRAMFFYIDEVPERQHHPKESNLLFPRVALKSPATLPVIRQLEHDHIESEIAVRDLQHQLLAWELMGESRRAAFCDATRRYIQSYLRHMRQEEQEVLPQALACLDDTDWAELDAAFASNQDPLGRGERDPVYEPLYAHIVNNAPAPIGLGD